MALARVHTTPADGTFSAAGALAWNAGHGVSGATSGGIPYFDSATSEASSALLAANGVVVGGGAGNPPATTPVTIGATGIVSIPNIAATCTLNLFSSATQTGFFATNNNQLIATGQASNIGTLARTAGFFFDSSYSYVTSDRIYFDQLNGDIALFRAASGVLGVTATYNSTSITGTIRSKYQSSDASAGVTAGPFTVITSITVKDGIVTALTGS